MKFSLAAQFLSTVFAAAIASPSSVSVAEELAKKRYGNHRHRHRDIDGAAAAAATSRARASRDLLSIHTTTTSKSSKSSSYCPPEPTKDVQCGNVYNSTAAGEQVVVTLGGNLLCDENITLADGSRNAALTLSGEDAVLNCQGYTISQTTTVNIDGIDTGSAAAVDCDIRAPAGNATERLRMKQGCGLYFQFGVILKDGAKMMNCNIQKFYNGAGIEDGGKIENSDLNLNWRGVQILNRGANTVSKVVNSEIYNNYGGLYALQYNGDDANNKFIIEDVTAKNNANGMYLTGTGITVNNANIKNNNNAGLVIGSLAGNEITLAGDVTITNNEIAGIITAASSVQGTVHVTGNLDLNRNGEYGVATNAANLTFAVGGSYSGKSGKSVGSGSLTACDNSLFDIFNFAGSTFEGSDYTCGTTKGTDLPQCKPCHPGCPSPLPSESAEFSKTQQMASLMAEDLDLDLVAIDMDVDDLEV